MSTPGPGPTWNTNSSSSCRESRASSDEQVTAGRRRRRTLALVLLHRATHARARRRPEPQRARPRPPIVGMAPDCMHTTLPLPAVGRGRRRGAECQAQPRKRNFGERRRPSPHRRSAAPRHARHQPSMLSFPDTHQHRGTRNHVKLTVPLSPLDTDPQREARWGGARHTPPLNTPTQPHTPTQTTQHNATGDGHGGAQQQRCDGEAGVATTERE